MATRICTVDGNEYDVDMETDKVVELVARATRDGLVLVEFNRGLLGKVFINPTHVSAVKQIKK